MKNLLLIFCLFFILPTRAESLLNLPLSLQNQKYEIVSSSIVDPNIAAQSCISSDLLSALEVGCFADREVIPLKSSEQLKKNVDYLRADLEVCRCLKNNLYYKSFITETKKPNADLSLDEKLALLAEKRQNEVLSIVRGSLSAGENNLKQVQVLSKTKTLETSDKGHLAKLKNVTQDIMMEGETCIPFNYNFLELRRFPQNNEFWQDVKNMQSYKKEDWDYNDLKNSLSQNLDLLRSAQVSHSDAKAKEIEKKVQSIKARMFFLYKNESVRYLLLSSDENVRKQVFKAIKENLTVKDETCLKTGDRCVYGMQAQRDKFSADMREILNNPDTIKHMQAAMNEQDRKEYEDVRSGKKMKNGLSAKTISARIQRETQVNIRECQGTSSEIVGKCSLAFSVYCPILESQKDNLSDGDPIEDFESAMENERNADPKLNQAYQEASKRLCDNMRLAADGSGKTANFKTFKKEICSQKSSEAICKDRYKLFEAYVKTYPRPVQSTQDSAEARALAETSGRSRRMVMSSEQFADFERVYESKVSATELAQAFLPKRDKDSISESPSVSDSPRADSSQDSFGPNFYPQNGDENSSSANERANFNSDIAGQEAMARAERGMSAALKDKANIQNQIDEAQKQLAEVKGATAQADLERRIRELEAQLAKKDESASSYQKIIDQLLSKANPGQEVPTSQSQGASSSEAKIPSANPNYASDDQPSSGSRSPASVSAGGYVSGAGAQGSSVLGSRPVAPGVPTSAQSLNNALLSKYGISLSGSTTSALLVASDKPIESLSVLASKEAGQIPIDVTKDQYDKFASNDLKTLEDIYASKVKSQGGDVVRLTISTRGLKDSLEFYAIRESGKIIFQPVRKARLGDLKLTLPKT